MANQHAGRSIGKTQSGNVEAGNASQIAGLSLIDGRIFMRSVNEGELFCERHLAEQLVNARVAGDNWNGLGDCECGARE